MIIAFLAVLCEWEASRGIAATDRKREREGEWKRKKRADAFGDNDDDGGGDDGEQARGFWVGG